MKSSLSFALFISIASMSCFQLDIKAQQANPPGNGGINMIIYPVVREADGNQYLITPTGKKVTVPGLGIAPNATQVSVYRDQANHFWYTNMNGQNVAVTPDQLGAAQAQLNAQSQGNSMAPQMQPAQQSFYSSTPTYSAGYNGIPYGTPISMEGAGQYSYTAPDGNKQFVTPTPQTMGQINQWQQQVPYGQQENVGSMQGAQQMQNAQQGQGSSPKQGGQSRMEMRREHRAERLDSRSKNQARNATSDQNYADSKMQSGQTLGTGISARRSAREERRAKREERRADFLEGK